jgi:hypothetical protein
MTSYFPAVCTASWRAANQNSFSGSFEVVQKQASQEWLLLAHSGRSPKCWLNDHHSLRPSIAHPDQSRTGLVLPFWSELTGVRSTRPAT